MSKPVSILRGSFWATARFFIVIAKSILLLPLLLIYLNQEAYTFWILLTAANSIFMAVCDGFIRFTTNEYNLHFYANKNLALYKLGSGLRLFSLLSLSFISLNVFGLTVLDGFKEVLFNSSATIPLNAGSIWICFLVGNTSLNILRFFYCLKSPVGKQWQVFRFETFFGFAELLVLAASIIFLKNITWVILLNSAVLFLSILGYCLHFIKDWNEIRAVISCGSLRESRKIFAGSFSFTTGNFIEKLSTDSYPLVLSFFQVHAIAISQFASLRTMTNAAVSGINIFQTVLSPKMQQQHAINDRAGLSLMFRYLWFISSALVGTACILFYPLLQHLYKIWTSGKLAFDAQMFAFMFLLLLPVLFGNVMQFYLKQVNKARTSLVTICIKTAIMIAVFFLFKTNTLSPVLPLLIAEIISSIILLPLLINRGSAETISVQSLLISMLPYLMIALAIIVYQLYAFNFPIALGFFAAFVILNLLCVGFPGYMSGIKDLAADPIDK